MSEKLRARSKRTGEAMRVLELFAGTQSVGKGFKRRGHQVLSLDLDPKSHPDICTDILAFDYQAFEPGAFDVVWASPPCTQYSKARTTGPPRDLEGADKIVQRTLDIIKHLRPRCYFLENPQTGLLKTREVVRGIPYRDITYCSYGRPFRKLTRVWTNCEAWRPRPICDGQTCPSILNGRHLQTAQRGPGMVGGARMGNDDIKLDMLHALPPALVDEIVLASEVPGDLPLGF